MKLGFVTFANSSFMTPTRIRNEAESFGMFDFIRIMNEHDISEFVDKHNRFIRRNPKGYGFYIWKPKVILDTLERMNENDILLYCDAGMKLNSKGLPRFREYVDQVRDVLVFSTNDSYVPQRYVKQDAIMQYFPEFNDTSRFKRYYYAGVMLFRKTPKTMNLVRDYLALCETEWLLDNTETGRYTRISMFQGHDKDNALFNLCLAKHNIHTDIYPDETNLYDSSGTQDYGATDWSSLDAYPLQYRRLRPGNKQYDA